jgi:kynurenine 3-monooxygenase
MLIALPNTDKSFTCTLFLPFEGENSFAALQNPQQVINFFNKTFPDTVALMPQLEEEFFKNPTSNLVTIKCYPWSKFGKSLLMGDAAHAIVPFFGQGMNSGFEDCRIFTELMNTYRGNWKALLEHFQALRKPDADAIAELALQNFIEMRDLVADPKFLRRKKIEARLHELYPERWIPLYTMVTFSDMRYSEALAIGKRQDQIMKEVMEEYKDVNFENIDYQQIVDTL